MSEHEHTSGIIFRLARKPTDR